MTNTNNTFPNNEPLILITNDDGITAGGIEVLIAAAKKFGKVVVVAPDTPQSGMGHAITIGTPLRLSKVHIFGNETEAYQCSGTPVDCVKLAVDIVMHRKPDFCFSGINHGSNASINVIYSGTMSAATEASIEGIPSVGFSFLNYNADADFTTAKIVVETIMQQMMDSKHAPHTLYNVNIPDVPASELKGIKICRQANAKWSENFVERTDPQGKKYYWLTGEFVNNDTGTDTDIWALQNNFASVVPVQYDLTNYKALEIIDDSWKNLTLK